MPSITPSLWFDHNLEEAAAFYTSIFPNSHMEDLNRSTDAGPGEPGSVLSGTFVLDGNRLIGNNVKVGYTSKIVAAHPSSKAVAGREEKPMAPDRLSSLVGLCAAPLAIALSLPPTASADNPSWNGLYAITFMVGPKDGTSVAASQPESQHTETYGFRSSCTSGKCVATIVSGPPPSNPTVPQPVQFTWDGSSWSQVSDFQWDCMMPDTTIQWSPARSNVRYTPEANGTLAGVMHTDILSGPCQGWIEMDTTAERA